MHPKGFIPLTEIDPAVCALPIPEYVDHARVGVNMQRLGHIAALGGFKMDEICIRSQTGEISSISVGITGRSGNGALAAGAAAAKKAKTARHDSGAPEGERTETPGPLHIILNSSEIADRAQKGKPPIRTPQAWTRHIDRAVRREVHGAVWRNMVLSRPSRTEAIASAGGMAYLAFNASTGIYTLPMFVQAIPDMIALGLINIVPLANTLQDSRVREAPFSFIPAFHVDRAMLATGKTLTTRIVKPI